MKQRIHQAALVDDNDAKPGLLRFDGASQASGPGTDDHDVGAHLRMRLNFGLGQSFNGIGGKKLGHCSVTGPPQ